MSGKSQRGAPEFASDQRAEILRLLREAGAQGVSKEVLIFESHFSQCGARVFELERMGYQIRHETRPGDRYVTFVLLSEPAKPKPLPTYQPKGPDKRQSVFASSTDWFEKQTGERRPSSTPDLGPLFSSTDGSR